MRAGSKSSLIYIKVCAVVGHSLHYNVSILGTASYYSFLLCQQSTLLVHIHGNHSSKQELEITETCNTQTAGTPART